MDENMKKSKGGNKLFDILIHVMWLIFDIKENSSFSLFMQETGIYVLKAHVVQLQSSALPKGPITTTLRVGIYLEK